MNLNIRAGLWLKNSQGKSVFSFHPLPMFTMGNFLCSSVGSLSLFLALSCPGDVAQLYRKSSISISASTGLGLGLGLVSFLMH